MSFVRPASDHQPALGIHSSPRANPKGARAPVLTRGHRRSDSLLTARLRKGCEIDSLESVGPWLFAYNQAPSVPSWPPIPSQSHHPNQLPTHAPHGQVQLLRPQQAPRRRPPAPALQSTSTASLRASTAHTLILIRVCLQSGCVTCRIRRKRCDEQLDANGACMTCARLQIECLGFTAKRPDWCRVRSPQPRRASPLSATFV
jgi:hypothetical protein